MPAPYAGAEEDIAMLERIAALLDEAAAELIWLRPSSNTD